MALMTLRSGRDGLLRLSLTLSFVLVSGLRAAFNFPSELGANWAFQVTEAEAVGAYLSGMRKWIVLCAILPLFGVLAPVEFTYFAWPAALFHLAFGIALSLLLMEVLFLDFLKVPFTCSRLPGKVNLVGLTVLYVLGFTMYSSTMADLELWLEGNPPAAALFFALAASAYLALHHWRDHSMRHFGTGTGDIARLQYDDPTDPVVRTLGITQ
jgi:hypothetical protein